MFPIRLRPEDLPGWTRPRPRPLVDVWTYRPCVNESPGEARFLPAGHPLDPPEKRIVRREIDP